MRTPPAAINQVSAVPSATEERTLRVSSVRRATRSTLIVRLSLEGVPFEYQTGQAVMIGEAGRTERVPYSIASAPEESERFGWLEFLIKIEPSGRWGHTFDRLARGMRVAISRPFGSFVFPPEPQERRFLFIAGGTGIAPIRAMIRHVALVGQPGRMRLLYSARTPEDFSYLPELRGMARRGEIELGLTVTRTMADRWRGGRGRIAAERLALLVDHPETLCFVCGPTAMVNDVPLMLTELGIAANRIRVEAW